MKETSAELSTHGAMLSKVNLREQLKFLREHIEEVLCNKKREARKDGLTAADCKKLVETAKKLDDPLATHSLAPIVPVIKYSVLDI